jgi:hypothetical protein
MKGKFLGLFLLVSLVGSAQWTGYTRIANKYRFLAGAFDSTFHIPSGATVGLRGGANYRGALFYKTGDSSVYAYTGSQWLKVAGNSSLTAGEGLTESPAGTLKLGGTISGGDTTLFSITGLNTSVRFKGNNGVGQVFRVDSVRDVFFSASSSNSYFRILNNALYFVSSVGGKTSGYLASAGSIQSNASDSMVFSTTAGVYRYENVPTSDTTTGKPAVLTSDGKLRKLASWGVTNSNIYNSDGTLTGDRTVNFNTGRMDFSSVNEFNVSDAMSDRLYIGNSTSIYSRVIGQNQSSINIAYTGISLFPTLGNLYIDSLTSGSTIDSLVTWSDQNGRIAVRRAGTTSYPIRTTTSNVTFGDGDHTVIVTGGTPSVTLPTASSYTGRIFKIVNHTGGGLTTSSHIDYTGGASTTVSANSAKTFQSNGTNWYLIGN